MLRKLAQVKAGCVRFGCRASSTNESGRFRHTASKLFSPTLRESPAGAHAISHALLLRAGFIRQNGAGIYTYMPLAQRVLTKITSLVDKNMIEIDGQKVTMPLFIPAASWKKSGRWETAGPELIRLHDRNNGEYCLSPTHEEIVTEIVANEVSSHKQLPMKIYQIGTKFRDEARPRFGLMRGREFVMKDMYSFHVDRADAEKAYRQVSEAYHKIFKSLGVEYRMVEADNGNMGGSLSHEFHILSNIGEDQLFFCDTCNYAANIEKATSKFTVTDTKELLSELLNAKDRGDFAKKVLSLSNIGASWFKLQLANQETSVALSIMGSHEANATKIRVATKALEVIPIGNSIDSYQPNDLTIMMDETLFKHPESASYLEKIKGKFDIVVGDFRNASTGDECPVQSCDGHLNSRRGIEVGHVFYLGTKYSVSMGAMINDPVTNKKMPIEMGCYGIGVSRVMAAVVESSHDSNGIIWPMSIAPFRICIVDMLKEGNEAVELYDLLSGIGPFRDEVILDERDKSAGVKLNDASLIGYPVVVVMGKFMKTDKNIEIHIRQTKEKLLIPYSEALQYFEKLAQTIPSI